MPQPRAPQPRVPRVVTRAGARSLAMSDSAIDRRLASGRWRRVLASVYSTAPTFTERDQCDAALAFGGIGSALSGAAALRAGDVRGVLRPDRVLVLVPPETRVESIDWVQVRNSRRVMDVEQWFGPRRVVPARAAADLALTMRRLDDVRALVARVVDDGHCTLDQLATELDAGPRRGSAMLRRALAEVGAGAASAPEARAATILRRAGVPPFEQNVRIDLPNGRWLVADFLWRTLRAILEIDSAEYHLGPAQWRATMDRHLMLPTLNYSVVHRPPSALADESTFVRQIEAWLDGCAQGLIA